MKIISEEKWAELERLVEQKERIEELTKTLEDNGKYYEGKRKDHEKELENVKKDHEVELRRTRATLDVEIAEKTQALTKSLASTTAERDNFKKESEILTKAFENLGFDVKDMKEILNKLVDGVVSKNQIQLINNGSK